MDPPAERAKINLGATGGSIQPESHHKGYPQADQRDANDSMKQASASTSNATG
ncbi:MAG: hypothetical protein MK165_10560 [Pirellulaceae bacterium]|nr:hypothetical protein [Pirellulaceae bacterium]